MTAFRTISDLLPGFERSVAYPNIDEIIAAFVGPQQLDAKYRDDFNAFTRLQTDLIRAHTDYEGIASRATAASSEGQLKVWEVRPRLGHYADVIELTSNLNGRWKIRRMCEIEVVRDPNERLDIEMQVEKQIEAALGPAFDSDASDIILSRALRTIGELRDEKGPFFVIPTDKSFGLSLAPTADGTLSLKVKLKSFQSEQELSLLPSLYSDRIDSPSAKLTLATKLATEALVWGKALCGGK